MHPGSIRSFYRFRRLGVLLLCVAPVAALAVAWWAVNAYVLSPGAPGPTATAERCVQFIANERGLPGLDDADRDAFVEAQVRRLATDARFRTEYIAALQRLPASDQERFRTHVFDAIKPRVLADIDRFHQVEGTPRREFLDDRIVEYNRLAALLRTAAPDKSAFGGALPDSSVMFDLLLQRTSPEERSRGAAYVSALGARIEQILADPQLEQAIRARIAAAVGAEG